MLTIFNALQIVLYVPLLALLGQGALVVLAGGRHRDNFFYKLLATLSSPFTWIVRRIVPASFTGAMVGIIAFGLVAACSFWVFAERGYLLCVQAGHTDCRQ